MSRCDGSMQAWHFAHVDLDRRLAAGGTCPAGPRSHDDAPTSCCWKPLRAHSAASTAAGQMSGGEGVITCLQEPPLGHLAKTLRPAVWLASLGLSLGSGAWTLYEAWQLLWCDPPPEEPTAAEVDEFYDSHMCGEIPLSDKDAIGECLNYCSLMIDDLLSTLVLAFFQLPLGTFLLLFEFQRVAGAAGYVQKLLTRHVGFVFLYRRRADFLLFSGLLALGNSFQAFTVSCGDQATDTVSSCSEPRLYHWAGLVGGASAFGAAVMHVPLLCTRAGRRLDQDMARQLEALHAGIAMKAEAAGSSSPSSSPPLEGGGRGGDMASDGAKAGAGELPGPPAASPQLAAAGWGGRLRAQPPPLGGDEDGAAAAKPKLMTRSGAGRARSQQQPPPPLPEEMMAPSSPLPPHDPPLHVEPGLEPEPEQDPPPAHQGASGGGGGRGGFFSRARRKRSHRASDGHGSGASVPDVEVSVEAAEAMRRRHSGQPPPGQPPPKLVQELALGEGGRLRQPADAGAGAGGAQQGLSAPPPPTSLAEMAIACDVPAGALCALTPEQVSYPAVPQCPSFAFSSRVARGRWGLGLSGAVWGACLTDGERGRRRRRRRRWWLHGAVPAQDGPAAGAPGASAAPDPRGRHREGARRPGTTLLLLLLLLLLRGSSTITAAAAAAHIGHRAAAAAAAAGGKRSRPPGTARGLPEGGS
jgi:hypothetical protein